MGAVVAGEARQLSWQRREQLSSGAELEWQLNAIEWSEGIFLRMERENRHG
jgi:hypothetical protein